MENSESITPVGTRAEGCGLRAEMTRERARVHLAQVEVGMWLGVHVYSLVRLCTEYECRILAREKISLYL